MEGRGGRRLVAAQKETKRQGRKTNKSKGRRNSLGADAPNIPAVKPV